MPPATRSEVPVRRVRRFRRPFADERGFALIEVTVAMVIFAVAGAALIAVLVSATASNKLARQRTLGQQKALGQMETIRSMDYDDIGISGGNPPGTLAATQSINVGGLLATQKTQVVYVNDPGPLSYETDANYKKVTVTITRDSDSKQLSKEVTYVSPPVKASATNSVIKATVVDYGNASTLADVPVALSTGPSAPRSDSTDASGEVTFAALTPNPSSGSQQYYDLSVTPPTGYVTLYDTVSPASPAHVQLSPSQIWTTSLNVYKPATAFIQLKNSDGSTYTGSATATLKYTRNSTQYSKNVAYSGSPLTITTMTEGTQTVQLIPGLSYTASAVGGTFYQADPATWLAQASKTENVPDAYPTTLTHTFTLTGAPLATVSVTVKRGSTLCSNATVTVSSGPWGGAPWNFSKSATTVSGIATITNVPAGTAYSIKASESGLTTQTSSTTTVAAPSTTASAMSFGTTTGTC